MNLNLELFKRYKPEKKIEIINSCGIGELLSVREDTILRMIKEAGTGDSSKSRNKFKTLRLVNKVGNDRNSTVDAVYNSKRGIFLDVYIQGDDTDTNVSCYIKDLLDASTNINIFGNLTESFWNGFSHTIPARYNREDRSKVVKEICISYIKRKYNI